MTLMPTSLGQIGTPPTSSSGPLSYAQLVGLAEQAGLPHDKALTAAAIALAESGGRPMAHNGNAGTGDNSYGLWQINMLGNLGPARLAQFGISSNDALYDPATNARAMFILSGGGGDWHPWTTYTSGAYKKFLGGGADTSSSGSTGAVGGSGPSSKPVSDSSGDNNCLLGGGNVDLNPLPFGVPGAPTANIPCLFYKSWGWAILGSLAIVGGSTLLTIAAILAAGKSSTARQAVSLIATKGASGASSSSTSRTYRKGGSVRPLQTADEVADTNELLRAQREAPRASVRTVKPGGVPRMARTTRLEDVEEPF